MSYTGQRVLSEVSANKLEISLLETFANCKFAFFKFLRVFILDLNSFFKKKDLIKDKAIFAAIPEPEGFSKLAESAFANWLD